MNTLAEVRSRPYDAETHGAMPAMMHVRTPYGTIKIGVTREDAAEFFESSLFVGMAVVTISLSGWTGTQKRPFELAEGLAVIHQVFGPEVIPALRNVRMSSGATYFMGLVQGGKFVSPTLLQDAALARDLDAQVVVCTPAPIRR